MKYIVVIMSLLFSQFASAGNGKALIPHWENRNVTYFYITNISNTPVEVEIQLYDQSGKLIDLDQADLPSSFTVNPKNTARLFTNEKLTQSKYGFGFISWRDIGSDDNQVALLATVDTGSVRQKFPVNNGLPF
ncbi:hypothetical protein ACOSZP_14115 [Vibrio fluvialis]|uniref:hypothetical protein n=1 Tax=Vibrio fluvialis TaxID=676 RepID=UPI001C9CEE02|nr:hypothetical protein [Vibrio fluvialis]